MGQALYKTEMVDWLNRLIADDRNFHNALIWFKEHSKIEELVILIHSLMRYWYHMVSFASIKNYLREGLKRGEKLLSPNLLGMGYSSLGWMDFVTGDWKKACEAYRKALIYSVKAEDIKTQSLTLGRLGVVERWIGEMESGLEHNYEAVELARKSEDLYSLAVSLNFAYSTRGGIFHDVEPLGFLKEALTISREIGDLWSISQSLVGLGDYYRETGNYTIAQEHYKKALELFQKKKDQWMLAWTLGDLGQTLSKMGDTDRGIDHLRRSILLFNKIGDKGSIMLMLFRLTETLGKSGREKKAALYLAAAEKKFDSLVHARQNIYPIEEELQNTIDIYKSKYKKEWSLGELMEYDELINSISNNDTND